jgi:hypothetical protein
VPQCLSAIVRELLECLIKYDRIYIEYDAHMTHYVHNTI